jgi:hypothetical protein
MFGGFQNHIQSRRQVPLGDDRVPTDVITLAPDSWTFVQTHKQACQIRFPDGDSAFLKRGVIQDVYLRERGAYLLSRGLGLSVVPETQLVELNNAGFGLHNGFIKKVSGIFSIQDEVKGPSLEAVALSAERQGLKKEGIDFKSFVELFVYVFIANDPDHENQNVMLDKKNRQLRAIDNEYSGCLEACRLSFPEVLTSYFSPRRTLPDIYMEKLQRFIDLRPEIEAELRPFYSPKAIRRMFQRAEYLLENPELEDINLKMRRFRAEQRRRRNTPGTER